MHTKLIIIIHPCPRHSPHQHQHLQFHTISKRNKANSFDAVPPAPIIERYLSDQAVSTMKSYAVVLLLLARSTAVGAAGRTPAEPRRLGSARRQPPTPPGRVRRVQRSEDRKAPRGWPIRELERLENLERRAEEAPGRPDNAESSNYIERPKEPLAEEEERRHVETATVGRAAESRSEANAVEYGDVNATHGEPVHMEATEELLEDLAYIERTREARGGSLLRSKAPVTKEQRGEILANIRGEAGRPHVLRES